MEENKKTTPENNAAVAGSGKGLCIGALVCGIVSIVLSFSIWGWICVAGLILGIVAIVLSVIGKKNMPNHKDGKATAGLVCGIIGVVISVISVACVACATCVANKLTDEDTINEVVNSIDWDDIDWDEE